MNKKDVDNLFTRFLPNLERHLKKTKFRKISFLKHSFGKYPILNKGKMKEIVASFAELTQDLWNAQVVVGGSLVDNIDPNSLTEGNVSFKCNAA